MTSPSLAQSDHPGEAGHTGGSLRHCLGHFATGVTVVSYRSGLGPRGLTINSFTAVSLDPPLVLICLDRRSKAIGIVPRSGFAINVLRTNQQNMAEHFAGRKHPGLTPKWRSVGDVPRLASCLAWIRCAPWSTHDAGDHVIVVGRVTDFNAGGEDPLCFYRSRFVQLGQGLSPADQPG
jgi:flavin reductase